MMGISWGGFNGLQVAALQPPALKAVLTLVLDRRPLHRRHATTRAAACSSENTRLGR
jgi:predicted acyl esterase